MDEFLCATLRLPDLFTELRQVSHGMVIREGLPRFNRVKVEEDFILHVDLAQSVVVTVVAQYDDALGFGLSRSFCAFVIMQMVLDVRQGLVACNIVLAQ